MPSPFPGMDPYIEAQRNWSDFHADFATEMRAYLNRLIRPGYYARAVTYVAYDVVEVSQPETRLSVPDVGIWRTSHHPSVPVAVLDPPQRQSIVKIDMPLRLANVEVRAAGTDRLVTAIEILSPINKRKGKERDKYLQKRLELLHSDVPVMEIDLLRGGERSPLETPVSPAPYYITLSRSESRPFVEVWEIQLDERLPVVPVPLTKPDRDVGLDIGEIVRSVYERGGYDESIDYSQPVPPPKLDQKQARWVETLLLSYRT